MDLNLNDLPPKVREQVLAQAGEKPKATRSRKGTGDAQPCAGSCGCGERFENYRRWETKHFGPGHSRWRIDLG